MTDRLPAIDNGSTPEQLVAFIGLIQRDHPADPRIASALAGVLAGSGDILSPGTAFSADVASTGGPSSLSTLLCPLYLRAAGAVVPKLGVPGRPAGGINCLIQIDGYRSAFETAEIERVLDDCGYAHFLAGGRLAPLDRRLFRLRQQHGAQDVPTLVAASLLSKKLAGGVRRAGLDIRVAPHGNFGRTWSQARENAGLFIEAGRQLSIEAFPVLTDGRFPYQPFIGRREALLALHHVFSGTAPDWLEEHRVLCRDLALACTPLDRRASILSASPSDLREQFDRNLSAQGASPAAFERIVESTRSQHTNVLHGDGDGFARFDLDGIRQVLVSWQKRDALPGREFPDPVGLILLRRPGEWVSRHDAVATVRISDERTDDVLRDLKPVVCRTARLPFSLAIEGISTDE